MKIHRSYYKEYLFFFGTDEQATGEGALGQQVDDLLAANVAVGAMCGISTIPSKISWSFPKAAS